MGSDEVRVAGALVKDISSIYRRAELEKLMWESRLDGLTDDEIASLIGLPSGRVKSTLGRMLANLQNEAGVIAKSWAIRQTMALWAEIYTPAAQMWLETKDTRYAEVMRGALSDIRKIWGVDAPQRIQHKHLHAGVIHSDLGKCSREELELLARLFPDDDVEVCADDENDGDSFTEGFDCGENQTGVGIPELQGLLPSCDS
jgi:hypothetical protein